MKKMKKFLAMFLAMAMVLGMSVTAFAADAKIKLVNMDSAEKVEYVQLIKTDETTETGWAFVNDEVALAYAKAFGLLGEEAAVPADGEDRTAFDTAAQNALWMMIVQQANLNKEIVTNLPGMPQEVPADAEAGTTLESLQKAFQNSYKASDDNMLRKAVGNASASAALSYTTLFEVTKDEDGNETNPDVRTTEITVSVAGVYAIKAEETGWIYQVMAGYVGFGTKDPQGVYPTLQNATVNAKKSQTTTEKSVDEDDKVVAIGDIITYSITVKVPYINPTDNGKEFSVTDEIKGATYYIPQLSEGEDVKNAEAVAAMPGYIATVEMTSDDVSILGGAEMFAINGNTFKVDLSALINDENSNVGNDVVITYTAKVTDVTVENTAQGHAGGSDFSSSPEVKVYSGSIVLVKVNEDGEGLNEAEFTLSKVTTDAAGNEVYGDPLKFEVQADGTYKYAPESKVANAEIVKSADVTVDGRMLTGIVIVTGLDKGEYHFTETKAPKGYSINTDGADTEIEVTGEANAVIVANAQMIDTTLNALPSTGGIGTTIFTIGGCVIMVAAAGLFFATRKKSSEK